MNLHIAVPEEILRELFRHATHSARMLSHVNAHDPLVVLAVSAAQLDVEHIAQQVASLLGAEYALEEPRAPLSQASPNPRHRTVALMVGRSPSQNRLAFDPEDEPTLTHHRSPR